MEFRLDTVFESWGGFSETTDGLPRFSGRLTYLPDQGITLELVEYPNGVQALSAGGCRELGTIYGVETGTQLVYGFPNLPILAASPFHPPIANRRRC